MTLDLTGLGYDQKPASSLMELVRVGRGTPYGEVLRRYWHPVALARDATTTPKRITILDEELILFRTRSGTPGLLTPNCAHRGASLFYGGVETNGIRCCYHGWVYDPQGRCLEQPCEPDGGRHRDRVRQPWYPLREYHGLLFTYMGPADRVPDFITWDVLHDLAEGEMVVADDQGFSGGGPAELDFNWLNHYENVLDPFHVPILHARFSGNQFIPEMGIMPEVEFHYTSTGVGARSVRRSKTGHEHYRATEVVLPNVRLVSSPLVTDQGACRYIGWVVPRDDTHFAIFHLARTTPGVDSFGRSRFQMGGETWAEPGTEGAAPPPPRTAGKAWGELTPEEHQRTPGDYEAQKSQGDIPVHSREFLSTTDQGVTMIRRLMAKQIKAVAAGQDPIGVSRTGSDMVHAVRAGTWTDRAPWLAAV